MYRDNRPVTPDEWLAFMEEYGIGSVDAFIELLEMDDTLAYEDDEFWGQPDTEIVL